MNCSKKIGSASGVLVSRSRTAAHLSLGITQGPSSKPLHFMGSCDPASGSGLVHFIHGLVNLSLRAWDGRDGTLAASKLGWLLLFLQSRGILLLLLNSSSNGHGPRRVAAHVPKSWIIILDPRPTRLRLPHLLLRLPHPLVGFGGGRALTTSMDGGRTCLEIGGRPFCGCPCTSPTLGSTLIKAFSVHVQSGSELSMEVSRL